MDWIFIGYFIENVAVLIIPAMLVVALFLFVLGLVTYIGEYKDERSADEDEIAARICSHPIRIIFLVLFCWFLGMLSVMPKVLIKTNIAKIKLRYTDMETVFAGSLARYIVYVMSLLSSQTREMIILDMEKVKGRRLWLEKVRGK